MAASIDLTHEGPAAVGNRRRRSFNVREHVIAYLMVAPPVLFLCVIIVYPALKAVWDTLAVQHVVVHNGVQSVERTFTFDTYSAIWNDSYTRKAILYSLRVTITSVIALFAFCYPLAIYLRFSHGYITSMFRSLTLIPLFIPTIISAYAFISFYQQGNFLDVLMQQTGIESTFFGGQYPQLIDNTNGIVMGQVWNNIPITVLLIGAGLGEIDNTLVESARDVGAGWLRIFALILFPLTLRQALIAFALAFIGVLGSYNIPYLIGPNAPPMLGVLMDRDVNQAEQLTAQGLAVITFGIALVVGVFYVAAVARQRWR
jgi:putative spermidine/putrescine transport system permease protein